MFQWSKYDLEVRWYQFWSERPLWSAFAEMVRNSDFWDILVRIRSEFPSKSKNSEICHTNNNDDNWYNCIGMPQSKDAVWYNGNCNAWETILGILWCKFRIVSRVFQACIDYSHKKVRIYPPKDQKKVCFPPKMWSEKSQNFWHFCQNPIVGALH